MAESGRCGRFLRSLDAYGRHGDARATHAEELHAAQRNPMSTEVAK